MARRKATRDTPPVSVAVETFDQPKPISQPRSQRLLWFVVLGLCALTLSVLLQTVAFDQINLDDPQYINATVQKGLTAKGIEYALVSVVPNYWHPLTWLSHM